MDKQFRKRLKYARDLRGLTMEEVAQTVGVSYQSYQQWESGASTPRPVRLPKLAQALQVSEQWLAYGDQALAPVSDRVTSVTSKTTELGGVPFAHRQLIRLLLDPTTQARIPVEMVERTYERYQDVLEGRSPPDV